MNAGKIAIAFLHSDNKAVGFALCFKLSDVFADILEAGEQFFDRSAVLFANNVNKIRSYKGLDNNCVFRQCSKLHPP